MVPDLEKPRVTEIQVRMDCNGCVQKIKKALNGINGIYDLYIDFPKQKLTIVGWADPEKIVKAIKKTRKIATICSHSEPSTEPPPAADPAPETTADPPAPEAPNPPTPEAPPQEAAPPPAEPTKEPPPPQPSENTNQAVPPQPEVPPSTPKPAPRDVEEIHIIHHHPQNYGVYDDHWSSSGSRGISRHEAAPPYYHVTHSYNTHRPSTNVTEYEYRRSPPRTVRYGRTEQYYHVDDYQVRGNGNGAGADGNNITSIFSDENPNACRIA